MSVRTFIWFLAGVVLTLMALAVPAGAQRRATVCKEVFLPIVVHCSTKATLSNGYTDAYCHRS